MTEAEMTDDTVHVLYFSWIRETVGRDEDSFPLPAGVNSAATLIEHLIGESTAHARAFAEQKKVRVAINQTHVAMDHPVRAGDEVAFFPPVTGG